jgi:DNA polymerase-3 subunit epsilon
LKHRTGTTTVELAAGLGVCFTGEPVDSSGEPIPRERLAAHADRIGLRAEESFTKSRCQLLVAADPATLSGKAAKARAWGIPIVSAAEFLAASDGAQLAGEVLVLAVREAVTCEHCGTTFSQAKGPRRAVVRCDACRQVSVAPMDVVRASMVAPEETLTCGSCGVVWTRERVRGRKPTRCTTCR